MSILPVDAVSEDVSNQLCRLVQFLRSPLIEQAILQSINSFASVDFRETNLPEDEFSLVIGDGLPQPNALVVDVVDFGRVQRL